MDAAAKAKLIADWQGVRRWQREIRRIGMASISFGGWPAMGLESIANNLPFVFAYGVLRDALLELEADGLFTCGRRDLGVLMAASKNALPWRRYRTLFRGKEKRNEVAHEQKVLRGRHAFYYINAVGAELVAFGVLTQAQAGVYPTPPATSP